MTRRASYLVSLLSLFVLLSILKTLSGIFFFFFNCHGYLTENKIQTHYPGLQATCKPVLLSSMRPIPTIRTFFPSSSHTAFLFSSKIPSSLPSYGFCTHCPLCLVCSVSTSLHGWSSCYSCLSSNLTSERPFMTPLSITVLFVRQSTHHISFLFIYCVLSVSLH